MSECVIREFKEIDIAELCNMMSELMSFYGDDVDIDAKKFLGFYKEHKETADIYVAVINDKLVGFSQSFDYLSFSSQTKTCHIDFLYVREEYRGNSIGLSLVKKVAEDAVDRGCVSVAVTARKDNDASNEFYLKNNFIFGKSVYNSYHMSGDKLKKFVEK